MSGQRCGVTVGGDLLAQLEDGQTDGHDEAEEGQLQGVPRLKAKHSNGQWDQRHGLEQNKHEDRDDHLLELGLARLLHCATLAELHVEAQPVVLQFATAHLHRRLERQLERHVVGGQVVLHFVEDGGLAAARCRLVVEWT